MEIKKFIEQVKKENGNSYFTNKDLLFYLVGRIDKFDRKLDEVITHTDDKLDKKMDKKSVRTIAIILLSVLTTILSGICKVLYDLIKNGG